MTSQNQQADANSPEGKSAAPVFPGCPRCGSEMTWGGSGTRESRLGCIMGLLVTATKAAWLSLLLRPRCPRCGKISKFEVISKEGGVPGVFWFWILWAVIGGSLVAAGFLGLFMGTAGRR